MGHEVRYTYSPLRSIFLIESPAAKLSYTLAEATQQASPNSPLRLRLNMDYRKLITAVLITSTVNRQ